MLLTGGALHGLQSSRGSLLTASAAAFHWVLHGTAWYCRYYMKPDIEAPPSLMDVVCCLGQPDPQQASFSLGGALCRLRCLRLPASKVPAGRAPSAAL